MSAFHRVSSVSRFKLSIYLLVLLMLAIDAVNASTASAACVGGAPNGSLQSGEECDDNDSFNNDFCLSNCKFARCGDAIECTDIDCALSAYLSGTEQCDSGGLNDDGTPDACRTTCEDPSCGDNVVDTGEECDDGNAVNTDGCRDNCTSPKCGDEIADPVEDCDDGNGLDTDPCRNDCTYPTCGDGVICSDPACTTGLGGGKETCDDGNTADDDGCSSDCAVEGCGDGIGQPPEQCDSGSSNPPAPVETVGCDADCTVRACGDSYINSTFGETCDDGNTISGDGCRSDCIVEFCGDGVINDTVEECDNGNANSDTAPDACREDCNLWRCGDGVTDQPENCDDANSDEGDACRNNCKFNICGDGIVDVTQEGCDDGNTDNTDACRNDCVAATCGDGIVQTEMGENCDEGLSFCIGGFDDGAVCATDANCRGICGAPSDGQPCTTATSVVDCGQPNACIVAGVACDNSGNNNQQADACRSICEAAFCGDGVLDLAENCDSSDPSLNNYCMVSDVGGPPSLSPPYNCAYATCGDGITCSGAGCDTGPNGGAEQCDDGNSEDADACRNDCGNNICGDGVVNTGVEECDNGNANSDTAQDACRTDCKLWRCGDGVVDAVEDCDDGNGVDGDMCPNDCETPFCGDGITCDDPACLTSAGHPETCDDGNTISRDGCSSTCRIEGCGDGIVQPGEDCDGQVRGTTPPVAKETSSCDLNCTTSTCGDGDHNVTDGEGCDDGNTVSNDGCTSSCIDEFCGDGRKNDGNNEECDLGAACSDTVGDVCRCNCRLPSCGDNVTDLPEDCDDGSETAGCDDDCTFPICGDGNSNEASAEECDKGADNAYLPDQCRPTCELPRAADGIVDSANGEICDAGPAGDQSCNPDGCATGGAPESYVNGYHGAGCELGVIEAACIDDAGVGFDDCSRDDLILRNVDRIKNRVEKSEYRATLGNLGSAERNARQATRPVYRLLENLDKYCPESDLVRSCFQLHLLGENHLLAILRGLEANLGGNNP